jgi:LemA protein
LVEAVKGCAAHERGTFDAVVRARSAAAATTPEARARADGRRADALRQLFAVAAAYPALRASENFRALQSQLAEIEDASRSSRRCYNAGARGLDPAVDSIPSNLIASVSCFVKRAYFELERPEDRQAPRVSFGG